VSTFIVEQLPPMVLAQAAFLLAAVDIANYHGCWYWGR